jgi:hypothetical protein
MTVKTAVRERRQFTRTGNLSHVAINLLEPRAVRQVSHVNYSEGGLCLRLEEALEVRSLVRLQVSRTGTDETADRPTELTGRVAWVVQRLDLRNAPPFLFDVGIEFIQSGRLRHLSALAAGSNARKVRTSHSKILEAATVRGRVFMPGLERDTSARWHLVVSVEGVPCFSGRYPTEREALAAWAAFQRQQTKR